MKIITIIGTNGKTSTAFLISAILNEAGKKTGVIGTLGVFLGGEQIEKPNLTTPDSFELNRMLFTLKERGAEIVVIEASAHAIDQKRLSGIRANVAVFTNFSQDHLDYFHTMEEYEAVKIGYFHSHNADFAVLNADSETGRKIIRAIDVPFISYALNNPSDVFAVNISDSGGICFVANVLDDIVSLSTKMHGMFNVYNMLAAISVSKILGVGDNIVKRTLAQFEGVKGRFETLEKKGRKIIIDFAHTPDGLENVLSELRTHCRGTLSVVFGCGGDRDRSKRPLMGAVAERYADRIYLTADNSRSEKVTDIINEIKTGIICKQKVTVIESREAAIANAMGQMNENDCLLVAGKGGEETMEEGGRLIPFSDKCIVKKFAEELF